MRESDIHKVLVRRVKALGGHVRRVKWLGRKGAPDVLVMMPGWHLWVEEKRPGEVPTDAQHREHVRMIEAGCRVAVISRLDHVDHWFPEM